MRPHHWERRAITMFLLMLLATIVLTQREPMTSAVLLSAPGALLGRIVAFYFPAKKTFTFRRR